MSQKISSSLDEFGRQPLTHPGFPAGKAPFCVLRYFSERTSPLRRSWKIVRDRLLNHLIRNPGVLPLSRGSTLSDSRERVPTAPCLICEVGITGVATVYVGRLTIKQVLENFVKFGRVSVFFFHLLLDLRAGNSAILHAT